MDNVRLILFFALSFVLILLWQAWQQDYGEQTIPIASDAEVSAASVPDDVPISRDIKPGMTEVPPAPGADTPPVQIQTLNSEQRIRVTTDILSIVIDSVGGDIRSADLLSYPVAADEPDKPFRLMQDDAFNVFVAQSGLLSKQGAPDHHASYDVEKTEYHLEDGQEFIKIPLRWQNADGVQVVKTYTFKRNSYLIDVEHQILNQTQAPWTGHQYRQFQRTLTERESYFLYTFTGGVIYSEEDKYKKIEFSDMDDEDLNRDMKSGWAAMIQHYFVTAWLPRPQDELNHYYTKAPKEPNAPYALGLVSPALQVLPNQTGNFFSQLYIGPKVQHRLEKAAPGLKLTVDYGVLTFLAEPLFWLLEKIYSFVKNWGWSIVILTIFIKLVFYKLSAAAYRSMANMRRMTPKMKAIKERHGDDRQRMSQAMMELYKKEKINPLGGCLPMIVQIPVFIALYWVLLESVELRQASFIFWLDDLSLKDPYYILPLLMGATMYVQQQLNPTPPDPIQAKVMKALPFIFTAMFAFFPSGLVLYWVSNSTLSILQQWYITRRIEAEAKKA